MLQSIRQLCRETLRASDGDIGRVKDFYFDDQNWAVRYVVVHTDSWLSGRLVLLAPDAFENLYQDENVLLVNLTRKQIENSPQFETRKPVSRQYEVEYYRYHDWPPYWKRDTTWGIKDFPGVPPSPIPLPNERVDRHLRSVQAMGGYHIQARDGTIGHVSDF
jgi:hypothetical protein